jgi:diketogulonate reductase-like aldo/keto reductase
MEAVQAAGLTKSIGVSNFLPKHLDAVLKTAKIVPACNQIEFHPYLQRTELLNYHKQHGIATTAFGPLSAATKARPGPADDYLAALAKKYAVSEGEISLRWCIDQDIVAITTSVSLNCFAGYQTPKMLSTACIPLRTFTDLADTPLEQGATTIGLLARSNLQVDT